MRTELASAALALGVAWTNIVIDSAANAVAKKCLPVMRRLPMIPPPYKVANIAKIRGRCKRVSGFGDVTDSVSGAERGTPLWLIKAQRRSTPCHSELRRL